MKIVLNNTLREIEYVGESIEALLQKHTDLSKEDKEQLISTVNIIEQENEQGFTE